MTTPIKREYPALQDETIKALRDVFYKHGWGQNDILWKCFMQGVNASPLLDEIERLKALCNDLGEYKGSGINRVVRERDELRAKVEFLTNARAATEDDYQALYETSGKMQEENRELRATIERQRGVMERVKHDLEKARIWGGMDWTYQPLHPMHYKPAITALQAELKEKS